MEYGFSVDLDTCRQQNCPGDGVEGFHITVRVLAFVPSSWIPDSADTSLSLRVKDPVAIKKDKLRRKFRKAARKAELLHSATEALDEAAKERERKRGLQKKMRSA